MAAAAYWIFRGIRPPEACRKRKCRSALIDSEVIVRDSNGLSDFAALRVALEGAPHRLIERREKLRDLLPNNERFPIQFNDHFEGLGTAMFRKACAIGLEGIVSKRAISPYRTGPSKFCLGTLPVATLCGMQVSRA